VLEEKNRSVEEGRNEEESFGLDKRVSYSENLRKKEAGQMGSADFSKERVGN